MKLDNYVCENQLSIFDILDKGIEKESEPPILLNIGQTVYKVIRGDIKEFYVYDEKSWLCGENQTERGYRLKEKDGCYGCAWNSSIGRDIFTNMEQAHQVAEAYLSNNKCIRKENIKPVKTVTYSYEREVDSRTMTAFYSILDNGMVYINEFMTYHHICKDVDKAIKQFMNQQEFKYGSPVEIEHQPVFKNMYPCKNDSDWCYAEAKYGQLI